MSQAQRKAELSPLVTPPSLDQLNLFDAPAPSAITEQVLPPIPQDAPTEIAAGGTASEHDLSECEALIEAEQFSLAADMAWRALRKSLSIHGSDHEVTNSWRTLCGKAMTAGGPLVTVKTGEDQ